MFSTKDTLKEKADGQFVSGLAAAVAAQIDRDAEQQVQALPALRSGEEQFSIATLFLADRLYAKLDAGTFTGLPHLIWNGMDDFVFLSDPQTPFSYERANGRTITPLRMNTDGGSIPRILRGLKKFSSWGYAPAFLIHDWLFTAKKCGYAPDHDWEFEETATVMAEAMKTLMEVGYQDFAGTQVRLEKQEDTLYLMYQAVKSSIAENLWHDVSSVQCIA